MKHSAIVMGIGNPLLQDDRAGIEVVEKLLERGAPMDHEMLYSVGFEVMDKMLGYETAFVVDAAMLGREPGTIVEVTVDEIFASHALANSHAVTLGSTLKLGYELFPDEMPRKLRIILIQAEAPTEFSDQCTPKVQAAVAQVADRIEQSLRAGRTP